MSTSTPKLMADRHLPLDEILRTLIEHGEEYAVVLDGERRILWANPAFWSGFPGSKLGASFRSILNESSSQIFEDFSSSSSSGSIDVELHHPVPGGVRVVSYRFLRVRDGLLAGIGSDRSREMEMVSQMAVLVEELEREVQQRVQLARRLEEIAITDSLTGVFNRRHFEEMLRMEWARWERYHSRFGLILLDLDRFKNVNDSFGHVVGDEVLRRVSSVLQECVRSGDVVARYGGEEFAVIAIGVTPQFALELAERLRRQVRECPMPVPLERVTVSIGVATTVIRGPTSAEELVQMSDAALYRAKEAGRDRVELGEAKGVSPDPR